MDFTQIFAFVKAAVTESGKEISLNAEHSEKASAWILSSLLLLEKRVSDNLWALRSMPFEIVEIY